jgi:hypothetical protein
MKKHLFRKGDPATSGEAADQLDFTFRSQHDRLIDWLRSNGPATDQEIAVAMVRRGVYDREETARRASRTVREEYGLMVPAMKEDGKRLRHKNPETGASAYCWAYGECQPKALKTSGKADAKQSIGAFLEAWSASGGSENIARTPFVRGHTLTITDLREALGL